MSDSEPPEEPTPPAQASGLDPEAAISRHRRGRPDAGSPPGGDADRRDDPDRRGDAGRQGDADPPVSAWPSLVPEVSLDPGTEDALDPETAAGPGQARREPPYLPPPVIDTRRYQFIIGGVGLTLVVVLSIYLALHSHGGGTPGIAAGARLPRFVAPLASSDLEGVPANAHPVCNPARPSLRGLNVCDRQPLVLAFFVTSLKECVSQVNTLQTVSRAFPRVQFAAVAVNASRATTDRLVRRNGWTIPVAYDLNGAIGQVYGVDVCPIIELARAGGVVDQRLIGKYWESPGNLSRAVSQLTR